MGEMRRLALVVVAVLALAGTAQAAGNPVVAAAKRSLGVESSKLRMSVTTSVPGGPKTTLTGTGAQKGRSVSLAMRTITAGQAVTIDAVLLDERGSYVMYMRSPGFQAQLPAGKRWIRVDLSKQAAGLGIDFSSLVSTSQTLAPLEHGLVSTTRVGRESVAGKPTTHYRALVDVQRAAKAVPAYGKQVAALQKATGMRLGRTTQDVWVGADGRIRQMRTTSPTVVQGVRATSAQTITFLAYDVPVSIGAPPRGQVFSP